MNVLWFILLGLLLSFYAIFDGIDLGIGALHLLLAKTDLERNTLFTIIGPFWAGYEVWLVAAGGSMVAAFPELYAASFSGFYLVLTLVLWLLMGRGTGIEFRNRVASSMWRQFWDCVFSACSLLLALMFGAAVGNVVRGVPLDSHGNFLGSFSLTLNPYALLTGVLSVVLLSLQGANFVAFKTEGDLQMRARRFARTLWIAVSALAILATACSFLVRPTLAENFLKSPILFLAPLLALTSLAAIPYFIHKGSDKLTVAASSSFIGLLMASAGISLFPVLLPCLNHPEYSLTIYNAAAPHANLVTAAITNIIAFIGVLTYSFYLHNVFGSKVRMGEGHGA